jgi:hypothetical protein
LAKIYLHIGMPKTGSSALQAFLTMNHKLLQSKGFLYPNPNDFTQPFQTSSGNAVFLQSLISNSKLDEIDDYLKLNCVENCDSIFSYEGLFYEFKNNQETFFRAFKNYDIRIICYIRRLDNFIQSEFNQGVKNHNFCSFDILDRMAEQSGYSGCLINSLNFIDPSKMIIRPYEKNQFFGGNIYADFLNCIGLAWNKSFILPEKHVNPSLCKEALLFRMFLNETGIDRNSWIEKTTWNKYLQEYSISKSYGKPFQDHSIISTEKRLDIIKKNSEGDQLIAKMFLQRSDGLLFYEPVTDLQQKKWSNIELDHDRFFEIIDFIFKKNQQIIVRLNKYLLLNRNFSEVLTTRIEVCRKVIGEIINSTPDSIFNERVKLFYNKFLRFIRAGKLLKELSEIKIIDSKNFFASITKLSKSIKSEDVETEDVIKIKSSGADPFFVLKPLPFDQLREIQLTIKIEPPKETFLQVFFQTYREPWDSENKSAIYPLEKGLNHVEIVINQQYLNGNLRIDPGTVSGDYLIQNIKIKYLYYINTGNYLLTNFRKISSFFIKKSHQKLFF